MTHLFKNGNRGGGAPRGNQNAKKHGRWKRALDVALEEFEDPVRGVKKGGALAAIARECVRDALSADADVRHAARNEIGNRLDGKPKETIDATFTHALAQELTDDELLDIARGGSAGAAEAPAGEEDASIVH